ncbi:haloalkane dehalogenase [Streptomyces sp. NPDC026672]|uniref:haloalkane dehalogenase n=1 Tax=unclassified Streptomyces TaxID=2593676 RepID=UPI00340CEB3F
MHQVFVELYNYRPQWRELDDERRRAFVFGLSNALADLQRQGVEIIGYGANDPDTDRRAPYDFFSVYRVPDAATRRGFEAGIAASGWYDYFEQVNIGGAALSPLGALLNNVALLPPAPQGPPIPAVSPFTKRRVDVLGRTMAYVDEGTGVPVVFVHGDVMSSFLWRNVIPHLDGGRTRSLAVDLIGAGDSDKLPDSGPGSYSFATHARHFDAWMEALDLGDGVVLVGHDWGANVAFDWAMRNEGRVRGLAFSEAITPPFDWEDWPEGMRPQFAYLRTAEGEKDVLENNFFVHAAPQTITRMLAPAELAEIVRPYARPGEDRRPTSDWPREVPFGDDRGETRTALESQAAWLARTPVPKLHLPGVPGGIARLGGRKRELIGTWPNLTEAPVPGLHWTPEDAPHAMGAALAEWLRALTD